LRPAGFLVGAAGIEPATPPVWRVCSTA